MNKYELQQRTKNFHLGIIGLCSELPRSMIAYEIAKQLIRCAGSVAANYRASARAKSKPDFINKIQIVIEEADESLYWLEIITEAKLSQEDRTLMLFREANELTAIFTAINKSAKANPR